jgi:hypothetical protein
MLGGAGPCMRHQCQEYPGERRSLNLEGDRLAKSNVLLEQGHQVWLITPHVGVRISMYSKV